MAPLRSWLRGFAFKVAALMVAATGLIYTLPGCNTPFIPLPPPSDPTFSPVTVSDVTGASRTLWETRGGPSPTMSEATVYVFNRTVGAGVIVRAQTDGSYVATPLDGDEGDRIELHYDDKTGKVSQVICRLLTTGVATKTCPAN